MKDEIIEWVKVVMCDNDCGIYIVLMYGFYLF